MGCYYTFPPGEPAPSAPTCVDMGKTGPGPLPEKGVFTGPQAVRALKSEDERAVGGARIHDCRERAQAALAAVQGLDCVKGSRTMSTRGHISPWSRTVGTVRARLRDAAPSRPLPSHVWPPLIDNPLPYAGLATTLATEYD